MFHRDSTFFLFNGKFTLCFLTLRRTLVALTGSTERQNLPWMLRIRKIGACDALGCLF